MLPSVVTRLLAWRLMIAGGPGAGVAGAKARLAELRKGKAAKSAQSSFVSSAAPA